MILVRKDNENTVSEEVLVVALERKEHTIVQECNPEFDSKIFSEILLRKMDLGSFSSHNEL